MMKNVPRRAGHSVHDRHTHVSSTSVKNRPTSIDSKET
jgi:hypothetical protein